MIDLSETFADHPPKEGQLARYEEIRSAGRDFAEIVTGECPTSPERTMAIRKIEEAVMWANKSIAVNE